jgi:hypothetical protein
MTDQRKVLQEVRYECSVCSQPVFLPEDILNWTCPICAKINTNPDIEQVAPTSEPVKAHEQEGVVVVEIRDILCNGCQREDFNENGCTCNDVANSIEKINQLITSCIAKAVKVERERIAERINTIHSNNSDEQAMKEKIIQIAIEGKSEYSC